MAVAIGESDRVSLTEGGAMPAAADDRNWQTLERQDWHLWTLAMLLLLVLGGSLLAFMFPAVFWAQEESAVPARRAFFGYCLLLGLALIYMVQRQTAMRRLRQSLYAARAAAKVAEQQANIRSFDALPELSQFHDSLAMEYLRASRSNSHLAVLLLRAIDALPEDLGRMSALLRNLLRPGETLFRISENALGVILPGMALESATALEQSVRERLGTLPTPTPVSFITRAYPEQVGTVSEFERLVRDVV